MIYAMLLLPCLSAAYSHSSMLLFMKVKVSARYTVDQVSCDRLQKGWIENGDKQFLVPR